jgi:methylenetetrahydrofolate dehydrogenase (NADP+) / methenyltetrahydrofolate cyclohydrolase
MAAEIIDGKAVAARVRERVAAEVEELRAEHGVTPGLATVLVGDDPASQVYVRMKREDSARVGIDSYHHEPGGDISAEDLAALLASLNVDERIHGILLQLPLPGHLDDAAMTTLIDPAKDVDGLHPMNAGLLAQGREGLVPCTPAGVMELLRHTGVELEGARAVVVGRSQLVGKPVAALLLAANATVTQCHSRTRDLAAVCREADVLVAAAGRPGLIGAAHVAPGAVVIDVGITATAGGVMAGDVDEAAVTPAAAALTPVPGGVGPVTTAQLLRQTAAAAWRAETSRIQS